MCSRNAVAIGLAWLVLVLNGCTTVPGETRTDWTLQNDILDTINPFEQKNYVLRAYTSPKVVNTKVISHRGDTATEHWYVLRRGYNDWGIRDSSKDRTIIYEVSLKVSATGGTDVAVRPLAED